MALLTNTQIKEWLGEVGSGADAVFTALETRVTQWWEEQTERHLDQETSVTRYPEMSGQPWELALPEYITTGTPTVKARESITDAWASVDALDSSVYEVVSDPQKNTTVLLRVDGLEWPSGPHKIQVVYTTGYSSATLPKDLQAALLESCGIDYRNRARVAGVAAALEDDGDGTGKPLTLPPKTQATLRRWRAWRPLSGSIGLSG